MSVAPTPVREGGPMLSPEQLAHFEERGYIVLSPRFDRAQVKLLRAAMADELALASPARVHERDGQTVRSVYGSHQRNPVFGRLVALTEFVGVCEQLLGTSVYVHQFKINTKAALVGDLWQWHQDYIFWQQEDGMPRPDILNVLVFLDDVTEFNGPLMFIAGSHRVGVLHGLVRPKRPDGYADEPEYISNLTAELRYTVSPSSLRELASDGELVAPKGPAGTVLVFHPNLVHASGPNLSPFDRRLIIVSYNSVDNVPHRLGARPEFLSNAQPTALAASFDHELSPRRLA